MQPCQKTQENKLKEHKSLLSCISLQYCMFSGMISILHILSQYIFFWLGSIMLLGNKNLCCQDCTAGHYNSGVVPLQWCNREMIHSSIHSTTSLDGFHVNQKTDQQVQAVIHSKQWDAWLTMPLLHGWELCFKQTRPHLSSDEA